MPSPAAITKAKRAIDLVAIVEAAGVELRPVGPGRLRGLCPLHGEKTPSFFIFVDRQRWRCFGCGESGDAVDFIRRSRGCGYGEALAILGIDNSKHSAAELARIRAERRRREDERWRERELAWTIGTAIRRCKKIISTITLETMDRYAIILQELETIVYQHDLLIKGSPEERASLVAELRDLPLLKRRLLFDKNFDFLGWLRTTMR